MTYSLIYSSGRQNNERKTAQFKMDFEAIDGIKMCS